MRSKFLALGLIAAAGLSLLPSSAIAQRVTIRDGRYHVDFSDRGDRYDRGEARRAAAAERAARIAERATDRALARAAARLQSHRLDYETRSVSQERLRERVLEARERARQARYNRPVYYRRRW